MATHGTNIALPTRAHPRDAHANLGVRDRPFLAPAARDMETYPRILQGVVLPSYDAFKRRSLAKYWRGAQRFQWLPLEEVRAAQWRNARNLVRIALETVPYYREKYAGLHPEDIRSWDDFARLPPLTRAEVEEHRESLRSSLVPRSQCHCHSTGGTSGRPVRFLRTRDSYDWRVAMTWRTYSFSGYTPGQRIAYLWGAPVGEIPPAARLKTQAFNWIYNQKTVNSFVRHDGLWQNTFRLLERWRPPSVAGYVSSLTACAEYFLRNGLRPSGLRRVLTAAEPCDSNQRELIEAGFGAPLYITYGSREFMSIAGECECRDGLHIAADNLLVETAGPGGAPAGANQPGEILITDFHNLGTVFLRYRINDIGALRAGSCPCGRGLPLLAAVEGRIWCPIVLPGGEQVSGLLFRHVMKDVPEVLEYQLLQPEPDLVQLHAVLKRDLSPRSERLLRSEMARYLTAVRFEIHRVSRLRAFDNGKVPAVVPFGSMRLLQKAGPEERRPPSGPSPLD